MTPAPGFGGYSNFSAFKSLYPYVLALTRTFKQRILTGGQLDQIAKFLKVFGNKFYNRSSPNIWKTVWTF